jgi:hypothetical protein
MMRAWKAHVTERRSFLEVTFDEDDGLLSAPCLRYSRSEPDLGRVWNAILGPSKSRIMLDQFSGHAHGKSDDNVKDKDTESSGAESTIEPLETSASESEGPQSSWKSYGLENVPGEAVDFFHGVGDDDELCTQNDDAYSIGSEPSFAKHKRSRPCKGQRMRYRKALMRSMKEIENNPDFNVENADMPQSIFEDASRKKTFVSRLRAYQENLRRDMAIDALLQPLIQKQYEPGCFTSVEEWLAFGTAS